ncbi:MAG: ROK family transcriptional regulator [Lachnospiraceae bacterium]|nr:ROK family transcriptional regulator [Lachnospiraceae bacterium]
MKSKIVIQDQMDMKLANLLAVFDLLYRKAPISRADLAKSSGMSATSITRFVNNMLEANLVNETPSDEKKVGRTATLLTINESAIFSAGINIDSTHIHVSILNFKKQIVSDRYVQLHLTAPTLDYVLDIAYKLYNEALEQAGLKPSQICGIGMSVIGIMKNADTLEFTPQLHWRRMDIRKPVREKFQIENVIIDNDCNTALLGQCVLHPEYKDTTVACLCIGSGVGSSVTYNGTLLSRPGALSYSEIGHSLVEPGGMPCVCGNRGCLQTFLAEDHLITRAQQYDPSVATLDDIHNAWLKEIPWARQLMDTACTYMKVAINNLACLYNPEIILVSGNTIDTYWDMFRDALNDRDFYFEPLRETLQIVPFFKIYQSSILGVSQQVQDLHLKKLLESTL